MPRVSIIIPSYNHAKFLEQRLQTILNQTYTNWEAIIIDDKSSDNSAEIIEQFIIQHPNFKVKTFIKNEQNSGSGYKSWQKGLELADSEYVWIAETDDYSDVNFLSELVFCLESHKEAALAFCGSNYVNENERFLYDSSNRTKDLNVAEGDFKLFSAHYYTNKTPFSTYITNGSSVLFRRPKSKIPPEVFNSLQMSDIFLWTYLLQNKSFVFLNKRLNFFRRHEDSTTTRLSTTKKMNLYKEKIKYLEFFKIKNKNKALINHYFNHYVWNNKKELFNTTIFNSIDLKVLYYYRLIPNMVFKILKI